MTTRILKGLLALSALSIIFIGIRFIVAAETAEADYGIDVKNNGDFAFHYIKGVRDIFMGVAFLMLLLFKQNKLLGWFTFIGNIVPVGDLLIVLGRVDSNFAKALPHVIAIIFCTAVGLYFILLKKENSKKYPHYAKILYSSDDESIIELNINPDEKTPWHFHNLFSETFEIKEGTLEVGKGNNIYELQQHETITIPKNEKHYFNNKSDKPCTVITIIRPGNKEFESSILILKGLSNDGLSSKSGTPRSLLNLAIFGKLNNTHTVGLQQIANPIFRLLYNLAVKSGKAEKLIDKYASQ